MTMPSWNKFTILFNNVVSLFTATSEVATFEDDNLTDGSEATLWKATSTADQYLTYDQGSAKISEFATSTYDASSTNPTDIAFDFDDTLWISDANTDKIYRTTKAGTLLASFLTSTYDASATSPRGIAVDFNGTLWVTDSVTDKIYNIKKTGALISSFAVSTYDVGAVDPVGVSVDFDDTLWLCDLTTDKIYNTSKMGTLISKFATSVFDASATQPEGIAYDHNTNTLWAIDSITDKIYNITKTGTKISEFPITVFDATANAPKGITFDTNGTLWVCELTNRKIYNVRILLDFDTLFITGHNLNTANALVTWQYSADGAVWTDIKYGITPINDKAFAIIIDANITTRAVRVRLNSLALTPFIGNIIIGRRIEVEYPELYDPYRERISRSKNRTITGYTSDVTTYYQERIIELKFNSLLEADYLNLKRYFDENPSGIIAAMWELNNHPLDVWPMELESDDFIAPFIAPGQIRSTGITLRGVKE